VKIPAPTHPASTTTVDELFARALRRARGRAKSLVKGSAVAGALIMSGGPALTGCAIEASDFDVDINQVEQADWAQYEGQRNTEMVRFTGGWWAECTNPYTRFGCGTFDIFLKLRVKPVPGADLSAKEVGVIYRSPYDLIDQTAYGYYYTTTPDGFEEWHVPVSVPSWRDFFVFNAFYHDGAYHTFYDDNQGEFHAVNNGPASQMVQVLPWPSSLTLSGDRLTGVLNVRVADLDYDKELALYGTCDDWSTVLELGSGAPGELNRFYWTSDVYGAEQWQMDLDLPCPGEAFEYAVVYKHGVVNDATQYWFWDNNFGQNYRVYRNVDGDAVE